MKKPKYLRWILAVEAGGILTALATRQGVQWYTQTVDKPPLTPPGFVFMIAWTVLYALMGIGAARIAAGPAGQDRSRGLNLFVIQLAVNYSWSLLFFNAQAYGFALFWILLLWGLVLGMILLFRKTDAAAGWLQVPYLLWVSFAVYLTWGVWRGNS